MLSYPVRIALIAALGGFLFGFETAVISGAEKDNPATLVAIFFLAGIYGSLKSYRNGYRVNCCRGSGAEIRQKKVLMFIAILYLLSAIGCATVSMWVLFVSFRFIGGLAVGASSVVGPMYISEIAPPSLRGRLAGSFQLNIVAGIFVAYLTNFLFLNIGDDSWRWMLGIMVVPAALFWLLLRTIPESPRWLILRNRDPEATIIMNRLGEEDVPKVIDEIRQSVSQKTEKLFQAKYAKPIAFAVILAIFNQLSGINAIIYYAPRIFEMAGFDTESAYLQPVFIGAANLFFTVLAMTVIDRLGRKTLLLIGSVGMILFLGLTAHAFNSGVSGNRFVIGYLIGFIAFFGFSQGAVIWVFISEIFPNSVRSKGGSLGSFTHWIMAAIISWSFPVIVEGSPMGGTYSFLFYAMMMVLHLIFVWKWLPETKGRSLETIQKELGIK